MIKKTNPGAIFSKSSYRIDDPVVKSKPLVKSETYLTEAMEDACKKMDNYVRAWYRNTQELTLMNLMDGDNENQMNPDVSEVEFVQDGDLNRSLPHFVSRRSF